ncbi:MAG: hypothetical protein AAF889_00085 [Cyanobacteria bacterium P01_D01_bin.73]
MSIENKNKKSSSLSVESISSDDSELEEKENLSGIFSRRSIKEKLKRYTQYDNLQG